MESETLPLFKSHYSLGRSTLTLFPPEEDRSGPDSIFDIVQQEKMQELFLVDDCMSGFLEAYVNSKELNVKLIFGFRITICEDMHEKTPESLQKGSKYVIFAKNTGGYKRLIKISSDASRNGFYYKPRIDFPTLKKYWDESDLMLCVPFYDSFIFRNTLEGALCTPDFSFAEPKFFLEKSGIPFDPILEKKVKEFTSQNGYETIKARSIYYKDKKDFKAYLTFRCINNRSTLERPQLEHMCSDMFSFENWKEQK